MSYKNKQCEAFTKKGARCMSGAMKGEDYCGPHLTEDRELIPTCSVKECNNTPDAEDGRGIICSEHVEEARSMTKEDVIKDTFTLAGTGARELQTAAPAMKKAVWNWLIEYLTALKEKYGDKLRVMSGMAEGFDKALALAALSLDIKVIAVIPNKGYGRYYWGSPNHKGKGGSLTGQDRYQEFCDILERIVASGGELIYVMEDIYRSNSLYLDGVHSNLVRNAEMVKDADAFLVYNKRSQGTSRCFKLIEEAELPYEEVPMG